MMLSTAIRFPFQLAIYNSLGAYTEELKQNRHGGGAEYEEVESCTEGGLPSEDENFVSHPSFYRDVEIIS